MDDFDDLTPPPARALTPEQRARLRSRLPLEHPAERGRSWLITGLAAAAAVLVVVGGAVAVGHSMGGNGSTAHPVQPAGGGPAGGGPVGLDPSAPPPAPKAVCPGSNGTQVTAGETITATIAHCGLHHRARVTCESAVADQLPGAHQVAESDGVTFWQSGQRWVLCYAGPVATTVHHVGTLGAAVSNSVRFAFSTDIGDTVKGRSPSTFVAGGPLGGGDSRISYTFPDGHRQEATYVDGPDGSRWWVVRYVASTGVLADPSTNWNQLDPVVARLYGTDVSAPDKIELPFGTSGCAQANHGC